MPTSCDTPISYERADSKVVAPEPTFYDVFISYGRADSKVFALNLRDALEKAGFTVWIDTRISEAGDYQDQIDDAIERSDNFLFIISPHSVNSPYCRKEIKWAVRHNKRIIPILHVEKIDRETWKQRNSSGTEAEWREYQDKGLHSCHPNMHSVIGRINWFPEFKGINDFKALDKALDKLKTLLQLHQSYVRQHTIFLNQAMEWARDHRKTHHLLNGEECMQAEAWLKQRFKNGQQPCRPTHLHYEFICESIKNANNLMAQVFFAYAREDRVLMKRIRYNLLRKNITVTSRTDILIGERSQDTINWVIEKADNVVCLISPEVLQSNSCQQEIEYARSLNKRIIPLLIKPTDLEPDSWLEKLQWIDFTDNKNKADYDRDIDELIKALHEDAAHVRYHTRWLQRALEWDQQKQNEAALLRFWWKWCLVIQVDQPMNGEKLGLWSLGLVQHLVSRSTDEGLLRRNELVIATNWLQEAQQTQKQPPVNKLQEAWICASKKHCDRLKKQEETQQRRELRTAWGLAAGVTVALIVSSILGVMAFTQFRKAQENEIKALTTSSNALFASGQEFNALLEGLRAGTKLQGRWKGKQATGDSPIRNQVETTIWQAVYGVWERNRLEGHTEEVYSVSFSPNGKTLATASRDKTVKLWDIDGRLVKTSTSHTDAVTSVSFSPDDKMLATASRDKTVKLWNPNGQLLKTISTRHTDSITDVSFSPDGKTLASASIDNMVKLWSLDGQLLKTFTGHKVSFSSDGKILAIVHDTTIELWSLDGQLLRTFFTGHTDVVSKLVFSPDGKTLASASIDKNVKLWNLDGRLLKILTGHTDGVTSISFSPNGKMLVTGGRDKTVKLWSPDGRLLRTLTGHTYTVNNLSVSRDGKTLATASSDGTVKLWNINEQSLKTLVGHDSQVYAVSFHPNRQVLATASRDKTVKLWNIDGQLIKPLTGHSSAVYSISFSPDGKTLASGGEDTTVKLWSVDGQLLKTLTEHTKRVSRVSFSPDGKTLATASSDKTVKLWSLDGQLIKTFVDHTDAVSDVSFSPDGQTLATSSWDETIRLWSVDGQLLREITGHTDRVNRVSFSPDGQTLATASDDKTVRLWSLNGQLLKTFTGHTDAVSDVSFSPDGQTLATSSWDRTAKLWNLDGQLLRTLSGHTDRVSRLSFSPDGKTLATVSDDNTVKLWNLNLSDPIETGCNWVKDYLKTNPNVTDVDKQLCRGVDEISTAISTGN